MTDRISTSAQGSDASAIIVMVNKLWSQFYDKRPAGDPKDTYREIIAALRSRPKPVKPYTGAPGAMINGECVYDWLMDDGSIEALTASEVKERRSPAPATTGDGRWCQKCGEPTKHEEAWVNGQIWCHPCADATTGDGAAWACDDCQNTGWCHANGMCESTGSPLRAPVTERRSPAESTGPVSELDFMNWYIAAGCTGMSVAQTAAAILHKFDVRPK